MSDQNINPLAVSALLPALAASTVAYRPYYSSVHAANMKPVLLKLDADKQSVVINPLAFGISASSLHSKLNDSLAWLVDNDEDKEGFARIRRCFKFGRRVNAIVVTYQPSKDTGVVSMSEAFTPISGEATGWFNKVIEWLGSASEHEILDSVGRFGGLLKITTEEETGLIKLCASVGAELDMDKVGGKFRIAR